MPRRLAWPERIPVRWRIAITCAGLTFLILLIFAAVLFNLVGDRVRDDFDDELRSAAGSLAQETNVGFDPELGPVITSPRLDDFAMADDAVIRVVDDTGRPLASTGGAAALGPPSQRVFRRGASSASPPSRSPDPPRSRDSSSTPAQAPTSRRPSTASGSSSPRACWAARRWLCWRASPSPTAPCGRSRR